MALVVGMAVVFSGLILLGTLSVWKRPGLGLVPLWLFILGLLVIKYGVKWAEQTRRRMRIRKHARQN